MEFSAGMIELNMMKTSNNVDVALTYKKYYIDRDYEQIDLFQLIKQTYKVKKAIYPGSYIHISPSFIYPEVVYIDSDKNAKKFFNSEELIPFINNRKEYSEDSKIKYFGIDYKKQIDELINGYDLLISQYAGFISDTCKEYLKIGGILLVNNSHGDAGLASIDEDYKFISVVHKSGGKYRLSQTSLEKYFIPKREMIVTREMLFKSGKGVGYTKTAPLYIFQRIC